MKPIVLTLLVAAAVAAPSELQRRIFDGDSAFVFECTRQSIHDTVCTPGQPFQQKHLWFEHAGQKYYADQNGCTADEDNANCQHCLIGGGGLDSATTVKACWLPPAGRSSCDIYYFYGNKYYDSSNDPDFCEKTGDLSSGKITTRCRFNEKLYHPKPTHSLPPFEPTPVPNPAKLGPNPKIMIVGDSISHGADGDTTWRYRIWEWFKNYAPESKPEFVGPYTGTQPRAQAHEPPEPRLDSAPPPDDGPRTSGGYYAGQPPFQSNHFAVWGRQIKQDIPLIRGMVAKYKPDILLVLLGFNDMGWFVSDADGTLDSMKSFISEARKAIPGLRMAIANVPQRSFIGGRDDLPVKTTKYNKALPGLIDSLSNDLAPLRLVDLAGNYDCQPSHCPAGYDGLHPNAYGEYLIAQAFSRTLHDDFGVGKGPLELPSSYIPRPLPVPSNIQAVPEPMGVKVTWDEVYEASSYEVRTRIAGSSDWTVSRAAANRHDQTYTVKGIKWEFQIRSSYGDVQQGGAKGAWSSTISATADRSTPPPPKDIRTSTQGNSLTVSWGGVDGGYPVDRFDVQTFDRSASGAFLLSHGAVSSPHTINGLIPGHVYSIWVSSWSGDGKGGLPDSGKPVMIGAGRPAPPSGLNAESVSPTTVRLYWNGGSGAAGYKVYTNPDKTAQGTGSKADTKGKLVQDETTWGESFLYPGTWHFEFCVSSVNGELESTQTCVTPKKPAGS